jgi:hypothetical protein
LLLLLLLLGAKKKCDWFLNPLQSGLAIPKKNQKAV